MRTAAWTVAVHVHQVWSNPPFAQMECWSFRLDANIWVSSQSTIERNYRDTDRSNWWLLRQAKEYTAKPAAEDKEKMLQLQVSALKNQTAEYTITMKQVEEKKNVESKPALQQLAEHIWEMEGMKQQKKQ